MASTVPGVREESPQIETLRREVTQLAEQNLQLKRRLEEMERPARSPDDFAAALEAAVDSLQTRLSSLQNPISNFAVKEFRLETQVRVDVNALGQIEYRFVQPGASVDPLTVSRLTLDLVPLPKAAAGDEPTDAGVIAALGLDALEGLSREAHRVLHQNQIFTVHDFLAAGTRVRSRIELSRILGDESERLSQWLAQAKLLTLPDLDAKAARVLAEAGIRGVTDLAVASIEDLMTTWRRHSDAGTGQPEALEPARAAEWIRVAGLLTGRRAKASPPASVVGDQPPRT